MINVVSCAISQKQKIGTFSHHAYNTYTAHTTKMWTQQRLWRRVFQRILPQNSATLSTLTTPKLPKPLHPSQSIQQSIQQWASQNSWPTFGLHAMRCLTTTTPAWMPRRPLGDQLKEAKRIEKVQLDVLRGMCVIPASARPSLYIIRYDTPDHHASPQQSWTRHQAMC